MERRDTSMQIRAVIVGGLLVLAAVIATRADVVTASVQSPPAPQAAAAIDPKPLYTKLCEACHGPDGKAPAPEMGFVARQWKHGTTTADIIKIITGGVPGTAMLPFKGRLREPEIAAMARYVRSLDKRLKPQKGDGL